MGVGKGVFFSVGLRGDSVKRYAARVFKTQSPRGFIKALARGVVPRAAYYAEFRVVLYLGYNRVSA